tara:strand:- start:22558 stop:22998 length:441 start_codon:yes stop_codon:yes gene_type:complete
VQKITSFLCISLLLLPATSTAECAQIVPVKKGQVVLCDGVLIRSDAVPNVIVNLTTAEEKCKLKLDEQKEKSDAFCKAETDKMKAWENATSKLTEKRMKIKEEHISFLTKEIKRLKEPRTGMWIAVGIVSGVGMTMAAAWSLNQVR